MRERRQRQKPWEGVQPRAYAQTRSAFQGAKQDRFIRAVEEFSGRRVIAFMSDTNVGPDVEIELFVLARPGEADAG